MAAVLCSLIAALALATQEGPPRPNLILVMTDQHRGDVLGVEGTWPVRTPNLDRLAREGLRFEHAYASVPSCTPSRAALLTGRAPWNHGLLGYSRIPTRYPTELPRLFSGAGWTTHAIGKNHFFPQRSTHGWQTVELDESGRVESDDFVSDYRQWFARRAPDADPDATGIGFNDHRAGAYVLPEALHPTSWTGDRAVAFVQDWHGEAPFLLKVSFARPHSPYDPPARLLEHYTEVEMPAAARADWSDDQFGSIVDEADFTAARNNLPQAAVIAARRAYCANVEFIDEQIGRLLAALEARDELDDCVILFTSDHGDMLGDHHLWRKTYAYEGSARIPMLVWWGEDALGEEAPERGQVLPQPVELRDVLPTLLDAAGLPCPEDVDGASMLDLGRGGTSWRPWLDLEHATCYWPGNVWTALTDGRWKYVFHAFDGTEQLFDLDADPREERDLARDPDHATLLALWRAHMGEHLAERGENWVTQDGSPAVRTGTILHSPGYPR
ncbi:arylsulfatase [Engelhardtia mirabilis]|uniref:Arylsulfatase n=1 Tax=Engelhardtia mirabilis TaxID=2528011 RepID=A0A518BRC6_9BACT|nr:Arylsulfatase [Planctomycetes bacterium Pla133]QDV03850.1 Arylsulfatase [Planctomycetes bacterium Pla86]